MKQNRASHSGAHRAKRGERGRGRVPGSERGQGGGRRVQGGRDVEISLITISIRGRAQSTGFGMSVLQVGNLRRRMEVRIGGETRRSVGEGQFEKGNEKGGWEERKGIDELRKGGNKRKRK